MGFALPIGFATALLALPILALYVLKLRRREVVVGSVLLWGDAVRDLRANAPWQRLRPNLLLFLQLAALAGLAVALARPYVLHASAVRGDLVVVLDASLMMRATDAAGYPDRFAAAKARVSGLIDGLGPGDVMSIVRAAHTPRVVIAQSGDREALRRALDAVAPSYEALDAAPALSLASSLARSGHDGSVRIITGAGTVLPDLTAVRTLRPTVSRMGGTARDLAIVAFAAGDDGTGTLSALARIANYGPRRESTDVELTVDGRLLDVRSRDVPPGGQSDVLWPTLPTGSRVLQVHLTLHDDLAADNTAWAAPVRAAPRRVVLVTAENVFLRTALALDPSVRLTTLTPAAYAAGAASGTIGSPDLTILDGERPAALPEGNLLLINPPVGEWPGLVSGPAVRVAGAATIAQDSAGILRYVQAAAIHVAAARVVTASAWLRPALLAGAQPLLLAGERASRRMAVLTFDLHESDLPLQPDLPIMVANLLTWLAPNTSLPATLAARPGDLIPVAPVAGARRVEVVRPDGLHVALVPPFPLGPFSDTGQPGLYTLRQTRAGGAVQEDPFAINLFPASPNEGSSGQPSAASGQPSARSPEAPATGPGVPVDTTGLFAGLALAFLCAEWWVASRGR